MILFKASLLLNGEREVFFTKDFTQPRFVIEYRSAKSPDFAVLFQKSPDFFFNNQVRDVMHKTSKSPDFEEQVQIISPVRPGHPGGLTNREGLCFSTNPGNSNYQVSYFLHSSFIYQPIP